MTTFPLWLSPPPARVRKRRGPKKRARCVVVNGRYFARLKDAAKALKCSTTTIYALIGEKGKHG